MPSWEIVAIKIENWNNLTENPLLECVTQLLKSCTAVLETIGLHVNSGKIPCRAAEFGDFTSLTTDNNLKIYVFCSTSFSVIKEDLNQFLHACRVAKNNFHKSR